MIKVLHLRWGEKIGGVETLLKDIAKFSDRSKFENIFCFMAGGNEHVNVIGQQNHKVVTIPARSGFDLVARKNLFYKIREIRPAVVVDHGVPPLIRPIIKLAAKVPIITYDHGCFELYKIKGKHFSNFLIMLEYLYISNFIIANSIYNKQSIINNYKVSNKEIEVIYPGVDTNIFSLKNNEYYDKKLRVAYVGRVQFGDKGTDVLVQVAKELIRLNFNNFEINVIGDGPDMGSIISLVEKESLVKYFKFHGEVDDVPVRLSKMDIVLVTSKSEAFGLSPLEALSVGCHVVGFDVGGLKESIGKCKQATLIAPFEYDQMAGAIVKIGSKACKNIESKLMAHRYVEENYSVKSFVFHLEEYIRAHHQ